MNDQERETLNLDNLPTDLLLLILKNLNYKDLIKISQINKHLNEIANDNLLWKMKLESDIYRWKIINSNNFPVQLFSKNSKILDNNISYKKLYLSCCPDLITEIEILKKLKSRLAAEASVAAAAATNESNENKDGGNEQSNALTTAVNMLAHLRDYFYSNILPLNQFIHGNQSRLSPTQMIDIDNENLPKIIMFGPGLETTTSCLVTNLLWKSEFKTIGMIPGKDGYGSGIKLKLFNHLPFNLTVLYTNVSTLRQNKEHNFDRNKLFIKKKIVRDEAADTAAASEETIEEGYVDAEESEDELLYEISPQVKDACANASGYIYVIDNNSLDDMISSGMHTDAIENSKHELFTLMRECNKKQLPLLILSCRTENINNNDNAANAGPKINQHFLSCAEIIKIFSLYKLKHEWQIRNCQIFQNKMKDIVLGFDWILNKIENTKCSREI